MLTMPRTNRSGKQVDWQLKKIAAGCCEICGKPRGNSPTTRCQPCREKKVMFMRELRKRYAAEGRCRDCGRPLVPGVEKTIRCYECHNRHLDFD